MAEYRQFSIPFNSKNKTSDNAFIYDFGKDINFFDGDTIGLQSFNMYNSFRNITSSIGNNKIKLYWDVATPVIYTITLSDGFYDVTNLNYAIQHFCAVNGLYCVDGNNNGEIVYFFEIVTQPIEYAIYLRCNKIPNSTDATTLNYTKPSDATWNFPTTSQTGRIEILSATFGDLIGFDIGIYPSTPQTTEQDIKSQHVPQIATVTNIIITCSMVDAPTKPNNVIAALPINAEYGKLLSYTSDVPNEMSILSTTHRQCEIRLLDQKYNPIKIIDPECLITLKVKQKIQKNK